MNWTKVIEGTLGLGLVVFAAAPTPDDVTVVSPIGQLSIGGYLLLDSFGVKIW